MSKAERFAFVFQSKLRRMSAKRRIKHCSPFAYTFDVNTYTDTLNVCILVARTVIC